MRRGTTPSHTFTTDIDLSDAEVVYVTYKQGSKVILEKDKDGMDITSDSIVIELTQEDTLSFKMGQPVRVQIRARFPSGSAVASNIIQTTADEILKEGEL